MYIVAYRAINIKNGINDDYIPENKKGKNIIKTLINVSYKYNFLCNQNTSSYKFNGNAIVIICCKYQHNSE